MALARIKKGDTVQVISGRERGKTGRVLEILRKKDRVLVEKLNMVKRHSKPSQKNQQGGIIEKEAPLPLSAVMPVCPKTNKGVRVRVKEVKEKEGKTKIRVSHATGESLEGKQ